MKFENLRQELKRAFNEEVECVGEFVMEQATGGSAEHWGGAYRR